MDFVSTVKSIIAEMSMLSAEEICDEDTLTSVGINSLKAVELMIALEDTFSIVFEDGDLDPEKLDTVGSIISLVEHYLSR